MKKLPKDWPTVNGRPATQDEIKEFIAKVVGWYSQKPFSTKPHFCTGCTSPLEFESSSR